MSSVPWQQLIVAAQDTSICSTLMHLTFSKKRCTASLFGESCAACLTCMVKVLLFIRRPHAFVAHTQSFLHRLLCPLHDPAPYKTWQDNKSTAADAVCDCRSDRVRAAAGGASAGVGPYVEVVFLHKQSKTLIVTDAVVCVPPTPPQVVRTSNLLEAGSPLPGKLSPQSNLYDISFNCAKAFGHTAYFLAWQLGQPANLDCLSGSPPQIVCRKGQSV